MKHEFVAGQHLLRCTHCGVEVPFGDIADPEAECPGTKDVREALSAALRQPDGLTYWTGPIYNWQSRLFGCPSQKDRADCRPMKLEMNGLVAVDINRGADLTCWYDDTVVVISLLRHEAGYMHRSRASRNPPPTAVFTNPSAD